MMFGDEDNPIAAFPLWLRRRIRCGFPSYHWDRQYGGGQKTDAHELMRRLAEPLRRRDMPLAVRDGKFVRESAPSAYYDDRVADIPLMCPSAQGETQSGFIKGNMSYAII